MTYPSLPGAGSQPAPLPSVGSQLTDPAIIGFTSLGPQYGGVLGACIAKKGGTWSPQKCQDRLNALSQGYRAAAQMVLQLRGQSTNPNAPNVASINQLIDANVAGLANAQTGYAARMAAGDTEGAKVWAAAVAGHTADLNALRAQLAASPANANNTAAIAAYQGQMAANDTDYFNLTGVHLA